MGGSHPWVKIKNVFKGLSFFGFVPVAKLEFCFQLRKCVLMSMFVCSFFFFWKNEKILRNNGFLMFFLRPSHTCCKFVLGAMFCGKIRHCLRFGGILVPRVLCGQLLCAFTSISGLTHVVFSFGPCGQASSRGQPNDGTNETFPYVDVWSGLCNACPYPCWQRSMRYVAKRDQQRHGFLMRLSVSCCQMSGTAWPVLSKQNQLIG